MEIKLTSGNGNWFGESIMAKVLLISVLTLVLLIPSVWIQSLIAERQQRQDEASEEISDKWAGEQLIEGPVLILPYKAMISQKDSTGKLSYREGLKNIYILPEKLAISGKAQPEVLHRGIFDAVVYNAKVSVNGKFSGLELKKAGIDPGMVLWDKAKVDIGLSDLKGLKNTPSIKLANTVYNVEPDFTSLELFSNNLIILPDLSSKKNTELDFSFELDLRGSNNLNFLHLGKSTTVHVIGNWGAPSFTGRYLPEKREISKNSFTAFWQMPYFNRQFPQQWVEENTRLKVTEENTFGVKFIMPVDQYQKTMRSAKYAILIILLTFISLLFTEFINKKKVHLLQYLLIGAAMVIYYCLLLSFSEQIGFDMAYLIASVATIALIGSFIAALLKNPKAAILFSAILSAFYGFIYVIIQLEDLALLVGSVGIFIIVAVMMYLSQKITWEKEPIVEDAHV